MQGHGAPVGDAFLIHAKGREPTRQPTVALGVPSEQVYAHVEVVCCGWKTWYADSAFEHAGHAMPPSRLWNVPGAHALHSVAPVPDA